MTTCKKAENLFLFLLVTSMCIWGLSWSSAKVLSSFGTPLSITFLRFLLVPICLFIILKLFGQPVLIAKKGIIPVFLAGGLMAAYTLCFFRGLQLGTAGIGGVLVTTTIPIFAYGIGLFISRKLPKKIELLGLLIGALGGSFLLALWKDLSGISDPGNLLFIAGALIWALMSLVTSKSAGYGHPIAFNLWLHVIAIILVLPLIDFVELKQILALDSIKFWGNLVYFGVINSSIATSTYFYSTSKLGPEKASSFIYIVPVAALFFSWLLLDEVIVWETIVGMALAIVAVLMINGKFSFKK